jgi:hypothetical protein
MTTTEDRSRALVHVSIPTPVAKPGLHFLPRLRARFAGADLVSSTELWPCQTIGRVSENGYRDGWPAHLARLSGLLILASHDGTYGNGIAREIREARELGLRILLTTQQGRIVDLADCTVTEIDTRRTWQTLTVQIDIPPEGPRITPTAAASLRELGLDPDTVAQPAPPPATKTKPAPAKRPRTRRAKRRAEAAANQPPQPARDPILTQSAPPAPTRQGPGPSICRCAHPRIAHTGGRTCRKCECTTFRNTH